MTALIIVAVAIPSTLLYFVGVGYAWNRMPRIRTHADDGTFPLYLAPLLWPILLPVFGAYRVGCRIAAKNAIADANKKPEGPYR